MAPVEFRGAAKEREQLDRAVNQVESNPSRFEAPKKYVGYAVCDPEGQKIGWVKQLFVNAQGEPEYVRVRMGLLGLKSVLIPVGFVALDEYQRTLKLE